MGSTTTKLRFRFNNHKSRLRAHTRLSDGDKSKNDLIYRHFHVPGHHGLEDVSIKLTDKVPHESKLLNKEGEWAYCLESIKSQGLNNSDFFFNQTWSNRERKR